MVGTMRRLTLMVTVDKHWSLRLVWSIASFVWPLWCYMTISFLQGTAICSITGKWRIKIWYIGTWKKIYSKVTQWNNIYCMLVHIRKFTENEHSKVIYICLYIAWWYIISKISLIFVKLIPKRKPASRKVNIGMLSLSTCMNVIGEEFIF